MVKRLRLERALLLVLLVLLIPIIFSLFTGFGFQDLVYSLRFSNDHFTTGVDSRLEGAFLSDELVYVEVKGFLTPSSETDFSSFSVINSVNDSESSFYDVSAIYNETVFVAKFENLANEPLECEIFLYSFFENFTIKSSHNVTLPPLDSEYFEFPVLVKSFIDTNIDLKYDCSLKTRP